MLETLDEKIHDKRFLAQLRNMLQAGYLEDWVWNATLSGSPQGGVVSPILFNIYLDGLDKFVETVLISEYTRGACRATNPDYQEVANAIRRARARGDDTYIQRLISAR
jgi:retron-type reverse transcriptase